MGQLCSASIPALKSYLLFFCLTFPLSHPVTSIPPQPLALDSSASPPQPFTPIPLDGPLYYMNSSTEFSQITAIPPYPICRQGTTLPGWIMPVVATSLVPTIDLDPHEGWILERHKVVTSCVFYFFGAKERSVLTKETLQWEWPLPPSFVSLYQSHLTTSSPRGSSYALPHPELFQCSWTGETVHETVITTLTRIRIMTDSEGRVVTPPAPSACSLSSSTICLLTNTSVLMVKSAIQPKCPFKIGPSLPGILSFYFSDANITKVSLTIPASKKMFWFNSNPLQGRCDELEIPYLISPDGYALSIWHNESHQFVLAESFSKDRDQLKTLYPSGSMYSLSSVRAKRAKRSLRPYSLRQIQHHLTLVERAKTSAIHSIGDSSQSSHIRKEKRSTRAQLHPGLSQTSFLHPRLLQSSYTRAELQWGLNELSSLTEVTIEQLASDICHAMEIEWRQARASLFSYPSLMASYVARNPHVIGSLRGTSLIIDHGYPLFNLTLAPPLECCGLYCKIYIGALPAWLESGSANIFPHLPPHSCKISTTSFLIPLNEGVWRDIFSQSIILSLQVGSPPSHHPPDYYSFQGDPMFSLADIFNRTSFIVDSDVVKEGVSMDSKEVEDLTLASRCWAILASYGLSLSASFLGWASGGIICLVLLWIAYLLSRCCRRRRRRTLLPISTSPNQKWAMGEEW
ncbi:MAG: hypothetical protein SCMRV1_gp4 [Sanya conocephalus maculatus rhabdovirus 1]|nr:MAG: hypothetical protein SCMRV1_gp4 [Sanya conocephalus maculatus rhabdovirus 1]